MARSPLRRGRRGRFGRNFGQQQQQPLQQQFQQDFGQPLVQPSFQSGIQQPVRQQQPQFQIQQPSLVQPSFQQQLVQPSFVQQPMMKAPNRPTMPGGSDGKEYPGVISQMDKIVQQPIIRRKTNEFPTTPPIIAPPVGQDGGQPLPQRGGVRTPPPIVPDDFSTQTGGIKPQQPNIINPPPGVPASQNPNLGGGLQVNPGNPFAPGGQTPGINPNIGQGLPPVRGGVRGPPIVAPPTGFNPPPGGGYDGSGINPNGMYSGGPKFNPPPTKPQPQGPKVFNPFDSGNPFASMIQNFDQFEQQDPRAGLPFFPQGPVVPQQQDQVAQLSRLRGQIGGQGGFDPAVLRREAMEQNARNAQNPQERPPLPVMGGFQSPGINPFRRGGFI